MAAILAPPRTLGAPLDLVVHGLPILRSGQRPGTFGRAYEANRRAAIESFIDADSVAARVRERSSWTGSAADLLRAGAGRCSDGISRDSAGWPNSPRALAGRLRRAQSFLRALGIDITFSREGRAGNRIIRMRALSDNTVCTVSSVRDHRSGVRTTSAATGR